MYLDMLSPLGWIKKNFQDDGGDPIKASLFEESVRGLPGVNLDAVRGWAYFLLNCYKLIR